MRCSAVLTLALCLAFLHSTAQRKKVILDTDPGVDDAMAIILALQQKDWDIEGITTVFGNATIEQATQNALRIVELSGRKIPVYKGAGKPLGREADPPPDFIHGKDGLGNTHQPKSHLQPATKSAAQFLVDAVKAAPHEITIIAVGRLTNIATALQMDPSFAANVKEIVMMGGSLHVPGNVNPVAEANVEGDADAADIVFTTPWKLTMVGLDVTTRLRLTDDILERIKNTNQRFGPFIYAITRLYMDFHKNVSHLTGSYIHDPSAVMYVIDSSLFQTVKGPVRVVRDGIARGQTIMPAYDYQLQLAAWQGKPMVIAAVGVDGKRYLEEFEEGLK